MKGEDAREIADDAVRRADELNAMMPDPRLDSLEDTISDVYALAYVARVLADEVEELKRIEETHAGHVLVLNEEILRLEERLKRKDELIAEIRESEAW